MWKIPSRPGAYRKLSSSWQQCQVKKFSKDVKLFQESQSVPPPPIPKKSGNGLKFLGGSVVVAGAVLGGTVAYAKANPEFRQQVESNWPILVPPLQYILDEEVKEQPKPLLGQKSVKPSKSNENSPLALGQKQPQVVPPGVDKPQTTKEEIKAAPAAVPIEPKKDVTPSKDVAQMKVDEEAAKRQEEELKRAEEDRKAKALERKMIEQEIDEAAELAAYETIITALSETASLTSKVALESHEKAMEMTKNHTEKLRAAFNDSKETTGHKDQQWNEVVTAAAAQQEAMRTYSTQVTEAREELEKLKSVIAEAEKSKSKFGTSETILEAKARCLRLADDINTSERVLTKAQDQAKQLKERQQILEKNKEQFKKELDSIVPDVKLGETSRKLSEEELNSFIAYFILRIERLHEQLAEQQIIEQKSVESALEKQKLEDAEMNQKEILKEIERQEKEWLLLQEKKLAELQQEYEQEMRVQLRRQAAAHSDHLSDVMKVQEKQHQASLEQQERIVRQEEQDSYQEKLSTAMAKLRGVEAAIEGRADLENQNKRSQELWLACETLKQTIEMGKEGRTWEAKLKPLATEVIAIKEAAGENPFVDDIVKTIPEEALTRGVYNEDALRERWEKVQRSCKRVAMLEETGGSIFRYFISFFQSLLVIQGTAAPLETEEIDIDNLNNFSILSYTSYHLERGEFEQALRYANLLRGLPGLVAKDWIREARLLLEASQAAIVLASHASATGLSGLHIQ